MKILVLNCGSSSLKFQLIDTSMEAMKNQTEKTLAKGIVEQIGATASTVQFEVIGHDSFKEVSSVPTHEKAMQVVLELLTDPVKGVVTSMDEIAGVGHRIVHGGERFKESTIITKDVLEALNEMLSLAPLHNPHNLTGYRSAVKALPNVPHIGVFDTSFHQTMPPEAFVYGLPYDYYKRHGIRRYGFHGSSHRYLTSRMEQLLNIPREQLKLITCHLGNGCSIAAIRGGRSVDTSMGFTPLEGLMMGTRTGDVDTAAVLHIMSLEDLSPAAMSEVLNKQSGLLGVSGVSNDMRELLTASASGDERAKLAVDCFSYRIRKYVAAYMGVLNGVDAIVFAGGIGENSPQVRYRALKDMDYLGIRMDQEVNLNTVHGKEGRVDDLTGVPVYIVPTNEELVIARDAVRCMNEG